MSPLTDTQKRRAMYYGGAQEKKSKAAMRRSATHIVAVHDDLQLGQLGPFTAKEVATLAEAAAIMRRLAERTERAAGELDRIKAHIDRRHSEAMSALKAAPITTTADQVALIVLGSYPFELRELARNCAEFGAQQELQNAQRNARQSIAWDAAKSDQKPAEFIDLKIATLPALRQTHDALIRQIEQIVEAQTVAREHQMAAA